MKHTMVAILALAAILIPSFSRTFAAVDKENFPLEPEDLQRIYDGSDLKRDKSASLPVITQERRLDAKPGKNWTPWQLSLEVQHAPGSTEPLFVGDKSRPYATGGIGLRARGMFLKNIEDSTLRKVFKGMEADIRPSYLYSDDDTNGGRTDLLVQLSLWITRHLAVAWHNHRGENLHVPDEKTAGGSVYPETFQTNALGLRTRIMGDMDNDEGLEFYIYASRDPNDLRENGIFHSNEPLRIRDPYSSHTNVGWWSGMRFQHTTDWEIPIGQWIRLDRPAVDVFFQVVGGAPFDSPERLMYGTTLSVFVAKNVQLFLRNHTYHNIDKEPIWDPDSDGRGSYGYGTGNAMGLKFIIPVRPQSD